MLQNSLLWRGKNLAQTNGLLLLCQNKNGVVALGMVVFAVVVIVAVLFVAMAPTVLHAHAKLVLLLYRNRAEVVNLN